MNRFIIYQIVIIKWQKNQIKLTPSIIKKKSKTLKKKIKRNKHEDNKENNNLNN